ncbi:MULTISPECIES: pyridoxamine 5'-phosphate oxidase family protein [unclassified Kitasatospora]|uniref:pyridoxamine 5'-phosphate oxidase family protein n=1 Tax=unclassified Kitasatospora TaxID=2633591 RepID=UPI0033D7C5B2
MNENTTGSADPELLHRIEVRRRQLGLTEAELADRAGMSPRYFRHLLDLGTDFSPSGFLRIAAALGMTYQELMEGRTDAPPGQPGASAHPVLMRLTAEACWERLGTHGIGRIALPVHPGPGVFPVNYLVDGDTVVYRTDPAGAAAAEPGGEVSFQVDHIDEHRRDGWSVLIVGTAEHVTDPAAIRRLAEQPGAAPWAGGVRPLWIRVSPAEVSGRRIHGL